MKTTPISWLYEMEHDLHPHRLMVRIQEKAYAAYLENKLDADIGTFRINYTERLGTSRKQAIALLRGLVITSDKVVREYLATLSKWGKDKATTSQIRDLYRKTLAALESLLEDCGRLDTQTFSQIPLTAYSLPGIRMVLRQQLIGLQHRIEASVIEPELYALLLQGLRWLILRKGITRSEVTYALEVMDKLNELETLGTVQIEDLLYRMDFNMPRFFRYWTKCCNQSLSNEGNLHRQLDILIGMEDRLNELTTKEKRKCLPSDTSIRVQMRGFLKEKKAHVNQRIRLRRMELRDARLAESGQRILINLSVAQFGLFIRLFLEKGLLLKEDIGATFAYFAAHFRTPKTPSISSESLQKKSTDVEFATARKLKGYLIGMVNWLNEHYGTSGT